MSKKPLILGIETSCDETAASIITEDEYNKPKILSNIVSSQIEVHKEFGGVVPELAARSHMEKIDLIVKKAINDSGRKLSDIDAINEVVLSDCFDVAQIYYNLLNPSASYKSSGNWNDHDFSNLINNCISKDMGLMNIRIYAAGYLATDKRHGREIPVTFGINENELNRRVEKINLIFNDVKGTKAQKALRYGLSNKDMSTIVIGLAKIEHLEEALDGYDQGHLDEETLMRIEELQNKNFN